MLKKQLSFRILLIDDDEEMNSVISRLLSGHTLSEAGYTVSVRRVDFIKVDIEKNPDNSSYWRISDKTLNSIEKYSHECQFDLVIADYGYADSEARDLLWGKENSRVPSKEEAKDRIFTIRDLSERYEDYLIQKGFESTHKNNLFLSTKKVLLRSMVGKRSFDILGPVIPNRFNETVIAFNSKADIDPIDPRNEFYGGETYYNFYDQKDGRDFYRQIAAAYIRRAIDKYILCMILKHSGKTQIIRSVFNIAMFAGLVALLGGLIQYLSSTAIFLISNKDSNGWLILALGAIILMIGAIGISVLFESFSRAVFRWVKPEKENE